MCHLQGFAPTGSRPAEAPFYSKRDQTIELNWNLTQVSRQHVQVTVNRLLDAGILATAVNPRHKRSPLIALTGKGKGLFQTVKARDASAIKKMFSNVPEKDRCITQKTLEILLQDQ